MKIPYARSFYQASTKIVSSISSVKAREYHIGYGPLLYRVIFRFSPGIYNFASIYTACASRKQKTISQMDLFLSEGLSDSVYVTGNSPHLPKIFYESTKALIE